VIIPINEYAKLHGKAYVSVKKMAQRGRFASAKKIGKRWFISKTEPYPRKLKRNGEVDYEDIYEKEPTVEFLQKCLKDLRGYGFNTQALLIRLLQDVANKMVSEAQ
jgi:hypothetical protein